MKVISFVLCRRVVSSIGVNFKKKKKLVRFYIDTLGKIPFGEESLRSKISVRSSMVLLDVWTDTRRLHNK